MTSSKGSKQPAERRKAGVNLSTAPPERAKVPTVVPPGGASYRAQMGTLVDDESLEAARLVSLRSAPPDLASSSVAPGAEAIGPLARAQQLATAGDEAGALATLDRFLVGAHVDRDAKALAEDYRRALVTPDARGLRSLAKVATLTVPRDRWGSLALDHRSGFLLGFFDGASPLAAVVDMSGFTLPDALGAFANLYERGIIKLRGQGSR
jgi:hypothetical protein